VPAVTTVEGIDLAAFAVLVLDGANHDRMVPAFPTSREAAPLIAGVLADRLGRRLAPSELLGVTDAARAEVTRRHAERRAGWVEMQRRLHNPLFAMGAR
jgi:hypothetical protein